MKLDKRQNIESTLGSNPFVPEDFKILARRLKDKTLASLKQDGSLEDILVEKDEFVKIFTKSENRKLISTLSGSAKSLFLFVAYNIETGCDWIKINKAKFMEETGVKSENTYRSALAELIRARVVQRAADPKYCFVNPKIFFAGNRLKKYEQFVEVQK